MSNVHSNLVEECREMFKWQWKVELKLIPREANQAAECLVGNDVIGQPGTVTIWRTPPENELEILYRDKSNSIYTPLVSLHTSLLRTPQIRLFTPHSITKHSHPTLLTPHTRTQPPSSTLFPPNPSSPLLTKTHPETPKSGDSTKRRTQPPSSAPKPILSFVPKNPSDNPQIRRFNQGQKYQVSLLLYLICCIYSCIFTIKYGFIAEFVFEISSGLFVSGFYVPRFANPNLGFFSGFH